jgi:anti-sigma-K factor RskA
LNSWKSTGLSACAPPLSTFIIGTGSATERARLERRVDLDGRVAAAVEDMAAVDLR